MSQDFMDPEIFADFIVEAREHLETIEPNLLELEKAPDNLALLNEIFRPMHSLKGASGFLGLNRINHLAHKAENILDELRKGDMQVTSEIMDVILAATDALRQMIENLDATGAEGDVEIESTMNTIDAIMAGDYAAPVAPAPAAEPEAELEPEPEPAVEEIAATVPDAAPQAGMEEPAPAIEQEQIIPVAAVSAQDEVSDEGGLNAQEWIAALADLEAYALTAFGEGHLKDFIDEAREMTESLNTGLLDLERNPVGQSDLVNDLFRYFHNLKGNSGIIGFNELNLLTHEAETLLNNVRRGEMTSSHELVDLLLLVVDAMEALVGRIDPVTGSVRPFEIDELLVPLRAAVAGEEITLPRGVAGGKRSEAASAAAADAAADVAASAEKPQPAPPAQPAAQSAQAADAVPSADYDPEDVAVFKGTVGQQMDNIKVALKMLGEDSSQREYIDALYRCLVTIQNSCSYMGLADAKQYAERTAGLVDQARSSDLDFSLMVNLLEQETGIIEDMLHKALAVMEGIVGPVSLDDDDDDASPAAAPAADQKPAKTPPAAVPTASPAATVAAPVATAPAAKPAAPAATPAAASVTAAKPAAPVAASAPVAAPAAKPAAAPAAPAKPAASASAAKPAASAPAQAAKPAAPDAAQAQAASANKASSTIRVDHEKLDHLMNLIGELIINRNRYSMLARHLEENGATVDVAMVAQDLSETTYAMARISDDLQDTIMKVRMVPVSSVFSRFPRLVRDLSRKSGKEVDLILEGEETELDKSVVEVIGDPLVHLIRNAVDHGVESEDERVAKGKNAKGRVVLRAYHKGNSVAIEIEDDGKGIDPEKMREVAIRKGIITPEEAKTLDDREAMELIFAPGFSSAEKITDISGRGVGMDVVRTNIKNLKGSVSIHSEIGKGTRFTLSLPLTLAIIDALMVNVSGEMYAIPLDAVSETTKIEARRLTDVKGRKAVTLRGEVLGIVDLSELLGLPRSDAQDVLSVVVIHDNDRRLGLVVDRLLERQEIVIKPLGTYLGDLKGISGATIMGDGSVILILDPHEVYMMATSKAI